MKDHQVEKKFIHLPKYPGGKAAFQEYIRANLIYPKEALDNKIEGEVHVTYHVDGLGHVLDCVITKGLGFGCDEEAVRLIMSLSYEKAKNRGFRVTASMRTRIRFVLPKKAEVKFEYSVTEKTTAQPPKKPVKPSSGESYEYTILY